MREPEATLRIGDAIILAVAFDAGKARRLTVLNAAKEGVKGQVNAHGDVLQDLAVDII